MPADTAVPVAMASDSNRPASLTPAPPRQPRAFVPMYAPRAAAQMPPRPSRLNGPQDGDDGGDTDPPDREPMFPVGATRRYLEAAIFPWLANALEAASLANTTHFANVKHRTAAFC
jgi:hypothetical protein